MNIYYHASTNKISYFENIPGLSSSSFSFSLGGPSSGYILLAMRSYITTKSVAIHGQSRNSTSPILCHKPPV